MVFPQEFDEAMQEASGKFVAATIGVDATCVGESSVTFCIGVDGIHPIRTQRKNTNPPYWYHGKALNHHRKSWN